MEENAPGHRDPRRHGTTREERANCRIEVFNRASIDATCKYKTNLKQGPAPDATRDVGPPLQPFYKYNKDEMELMITSDDYCNKVVVPVLPIIFGFIVKKRICIAKEKEEAKERGPDLLGTMVMSNVTHSNLLTRAPVSIPVEFLRAIKNKLHPPIFWFADEQLRHSMQFPSSTWWQVRDEDNMEGYYSHAPANLSEHEQNKEKGSVK
ncbi:hypothetical protein K438DRAFT_1978581 [Mycena galopus ATCC 62051]|nr:hypothetical protein K438DRAFT_1978581 [Mycena galopus ATCC 62051]